MSINRSIYSLRWLFLVWMILIYLEGLWSFHLFLFTKCLSQDACMFVNFLPAARENNVASIEAFTGLMLLFGMLVWIGQRGSVPSRFLWLSFCLQGGMMVGIGFVAGPITWPPMQAPSQLILNLTLVFTLSMISMLKSTRVLACVVVGSLVLFMIFHLWSLWPRGAEDWASFPTLVGTQIDFTVVPFVIGCVLFSLHLQRSHAQLKEAHTDLAITHTQLEKAYDQLQIAAAEIEALTLVTERQRLARELHDTLAQGLTGLHLQLEAIRTGLRLQRYEQVQEMVEQSLSGTHHALAEARDAIDDLRTAMIVPENLSMEVQQMIKQSTFATKITCTTDLTALVFVPVALCEYVLRVIQEGLANVVRHARAQHIWIETSCRACIITIEIRDDGIGFDPTTVMTLPGHYGLLGLRERALQSGGKLSIRSMPGTGTTLELCFSIKKGQGSDHSQHETCCIYGERQEGG